MENSFLDIKRSELFEGNPFINNPHLKYIEPYKSLYERDTSPDKKIASNEIYAMFVVMHPDDLDNPYIRLDLEDRKNIVQLNFNVDWNDKIFMCALEKYPEHCMSVAERTLKGIQDKILERDRFLKNSPYTTDIYARDANGQYITKGNTFLVDKLSADKIDAMLKTSGDLYKAYAEAQKHFFLEKQNLIVRGGRTPTDRETGDLYKGVEFD